MDLPFRGQDRWALVAGQEGRVRDPLHLGDERHRRVEAPVPQHGNAVLVAGEQVPELVADQPVLLAVQVEEGHDGVAVAGELRDARQVQLLHGCGHGGHSTAATVATPGAGAGLTRPYLQVRLVALPGRRRSDHARVPTLRLPMLRLPMLRLPMLRLPMLRLPMLRLPMLRLTAAMAAIALCASACSQSSGDSATGPSSASVDTAAPASDVTTVAPAPDSTPPTVAPTDTFGRTQAKVDGTAVGGNNGDEDVGVRYSEAIRNSDGSCRGWDDPDSPVRTAGLKNGAPVQILDDNDQVIGSGRIESSKWFDAADGLDNWTCVFSYTATIDGAVPDSFRIKVADLPPWGAAPDPANPGAFVSSVDSKASPDLISECTDHANFTQAPDPTSPRTAPPGRRTRRSGTPPARQRSSRSRSGSRWSGPTGPTP